MDFDSLPEDGQTAAQAPIKAGSGALPVFDTLPDDSEKYGSAGQQILAGVEGVAKGLAGPVATGAEELLSRAGVPGISAQDRMGREAANPWIHGASEVGGFGAGLFTGASEASVLGHAGSAAAGALKLGGEGATVASRLAAGAVKSATEMGLFQAADEASKVINQDPAQTVGSAIYDVGLSAVLGGALGGSLSGLGMAAKSALNSNLIKEFSDRLAFRGSNLNPNEVVEKEFHDAINAYHTAGDEITGSFGLKSKAISAVMPEMSAGISQQAAETAASLKNKIAYMRGRPSIYPERLVAKLESDLSEFRGKALPAIERAGAVETMVPGVPKVSQRKISFTPIRFDENPAREAFPWIRPEDAPPKLVRGETQALQHEMLNPNPAAPVRMTPVSSSTPESGAVFDAMDDLKKSLQGYSKGNYGPFAIPSHHEAYEFLNLTKSLGRDVRTALENQDVWGRVAELQKGLNKSWTEVLPAVKDAQSKFMEKVGGEFVPSPQKFATYMNQSGKATSQTIRQKMMGNFVDAVDNHFKTVDELYKAAGIENPHAAIGMGALKESLERASVGSRLADAWFDKIGPKSVGDAAGAAIGASAGHAVFPGMGGLGGAYIGKELLGPAFGAGIKSLMEKGVNASAYRQAMAYGKAALAGEKLLDKSAANVFATGLKTLPSHLIPESKEIEKLDTQLRVASANQAPMMNVAGSIGHYMPEHAAAVSAAAMGAVNYLNSKRPQNPKLSPLDTAVPPSKAQKADFDRALKVAQQPLVVMQHIKDGTLLPSDVATLKALSPASYQQISQKLMNSMNDHLANGGTIPYKTRQSLSLFLGQPLDSTMSPQGIQLLQSTYAKNRAPAQGSPDQGPKKSTSKLGKLSTSLQTPDQARANRANKT